MLKGLWNEGEFPSVTHEWPFECYIMGSVNLFLIQLIMIYYKRVWGIFENSSCFLNHVGAQIAPHI